MLSPRLTDTPSISHIHDNTACLSGAKIFSKVDLVRRYHQVPVAPEVIPKTAVASIQFGLFAVLRMPFGLKKAAKTFPRAMDSICQPLGFVYLELDDILVASASHTEHREHLFQLFKGLSEFGFVVNVVKCHFGRSQIEFLGH